MPARFKARCPHADCGQIYQVSRATLSGDVRCKKCGRTVSLALETRGQKKPANEPSAETGDQDTTSDDSIRTVGGFEIGDLLGAGAFGAVHRGHDPSLDRDVAIKLPHASLLAGDEAKRRFLREAKAAARLRHSNIVPVYAAGQRGGQPYIASALVNGVPLDKKLEAGPFSFERAARIVRKLGEAVGYAHSLGIVHRDIKPANVMLDEDDEPQLMDFGLARLEGTREKLTQDGAIMGTPAYMAPEQARGEQNRIGPASDQYSLGVLLYELLTHRLPFAGPIGIVLARSINAEPESIESLRPDVPVDLVVICRKARSKEPADRYASCEEFAGDLNRYERGEPIVARELTRTEKLFRWGRRHPGLATLSASLAVVLIMGITVSTAFAVQAQSQARRADRNARAAEVETQRAEANAIQAETNARQAEAQTAEVAAQSALLRQQNIRNRQTLYASEVKLAQEFHNRGDDDFAREILDRLRPGKGEEDLRGFEWHYLWRVMQPQFREWKLGAEVADLAFSPDSLTLYSLTESGMLQARSMTSGKLIRQFAPSMLDEQRRCFDLHSSGELMACGGSRGTVSILSVPDLAVRTTASLHEGAINDIAYSLDETRLATGGDDRTIALCEATTLETVGRLSEHEHPVVSVAWTDGESYLASCGHGSGFRLWNLSEEKSRFISTHYIRTLAASSDGTALTQASITNLLYVWDSPAGKLRERELAGLGNTTRLAVSANGAHVA